MAENEEKKGTEEIKKDSLMWSEEDYDAMQKLTGFDEESVLEDQKKGINVVIFVIVCIVCLIVGIIIGYNINKLTPQPEPQVILVDEVVKDAKVVAIYNRLNASNELYLYALDDSDEEVSLADLTDTKYAYQYINNELYLLVSKDGLNLYDYSFSKDGYHRDLVKEFEDEYDVFYFKHDIILIANKKDIKLYSEKAELINSAKFDYDKINDYTSEYIIYTKDTKLFIYYFKTSSSKQLTKRMTSFAYLDNDQIFYVEKGKIYEYSIIGDSAKELMNIKSNSIFEKVGKVYILNDSKDLYIYDKSLTKIKSFEYEINEIAYIDPNNIVLILEDYNSNNCLMDEKTFNLFNVKESYLTEKKLNGCLNIQVINGYINAK